VTDVVDDVVAAPDGTRLAVRRWGNDPTFLLVHGLASNARLWDGVAGELAAAGRGSIAVDQRGHGRSEKPGVGFDFPTLSEDLHAVVGDHGPLVVVGQSWGGNVVLQLAAHHPGHVRGVVCVDGGFIRLADAFRTRDEMRTELAPPRFDGLTSSDLESGMRVRLAGWPETAVAGQLANFERLADGTVRARLARADHMTILDHLWDHDPDALADEVEVPILVVAVRGGHLAKEDRVAAFTAAHRNANLVWLDGDHDIHAQRPSAIADLLVDFEAGL
jgi:pimeloyl-ACP methyl ester carboxylesterase